MCDIKINYPSIFVVNHVYLKGIKEWRLSDKAIQIKVDWDDFVRPSDWLCAIIKRNYNKIMKHFSYSLIAILLLFSCNDSSKKSVRETVNPEDTVCIKEISEAEKDIKSNKLSYCNYVGNIGFHALRAEKEMDSLLKFNKVSFQNESSPCIVENNKKYHCYCEIMQEEIDKRFGKNYIDSLLNKADSLHVLKNLDKTYYNGSMYGSWDKCALFPGDTRYDEGNHEGLQKAFNDKVIYPKNYRYSDPKNSLTFLQVYLDVDRNGNAKIYDYHIEFYDIKTKEKNYNKQFWDYFKEVAFPLIEKTKWIPAKIKGINVNSKNDIAIYLK